MTTDKTYLEMWRKAQDGKRIEKDIFQSGEPTRVYLCACGRWVNLIAESVHTANCFPVRRNKR